MFILKSETCVVFGRHYDRVTCFNLKCFNDSELEVVFFNLQPNLLIREKHEVRIKYQHEDDTCDSAESSS